MHNKTPLNSGSARDKRPRPLVSLIILIAALAAAFTAGWFVKQSASAPSSSSVGTAKTPRPIKFYQSPMHPWITSDQPGQCTICGMDLVPVYDDTNVEQTSEHPLVTLPEQSVQVMGVASAPVRRSALVRTLLFSGSIEDDNSKHRFISAYFPGRIDRLYLNYVGARVTKGQPLAAIYSPELLSAQREFQLLLKSASASKDSVAAGRQRLVRLGLVDEQIERLKTNAELPDATEILSPADGVVIEQHAYQGQYVKEGEKLFTIADFSTMWFLFDVYERDLPWLKPGLAVEVTTRSNPGALYKSSVEFIEPNVDAATRSAKARVVIDNQDAALTHRVFGEARVRVESEPVIVAPRSAILNTGERAVAFVDLGGGRYELRQLKLGRVGDLDWEILGGLRDGESVVTNGALMIDAQAQLISGVRPGVAAAQSNKPSGATRDVGEDVIAAAGAFANRLAEASESLAADKLDSYRTVIPELMLAINAFAAKSEGQSFSEPARKVHDLAAHLTHATDIKSARATFEPFSNAAAELLLTLSKTAPVLNGYIAVECPMSPILNGAKWIQKAGGIRNPFFGALMLDCGQEVK
jgi:Cu(I)/Ag(I) efflux system membrane fusion protein